MKKIILSILLILSTTHFFALGLQHDIFLGESKGLDTAFVFGSDKFKNSVGLYFDSHDTLVRRYESNGYNGRQSGNSYSQSHYEYIEKPASNLGVYYQFTWSPTFTRISNIGIGMDLPLQVGICADNIQGMNIFVGLVPAFKCEFNKADLLIGYRLTFLVAEATQGVMPFKSACTIGVRYTLKKRAGAKTSSGKSTSISIKKKTSDVPADSGNSDVNIIPGTDIKTIAD